MKKHTIKVGEPIFLQRKIESYLTGTSYSLTKKRFSRHETATDFFFIPDNRAISDLISVNAELHRVKHFATLKDGVLFGALLELGNYGTVTRASVY